VRLKHPIICQDKGFSHLSCYAGHYKHIHAFLKVNKLFKRHTVAVDVHIVALLFLDNNGLKDMGPAIYVAVMRKLQLICCAFLKVNILFKRLAITIHAQKVSLLLLDKVSGH
jgi:hypothetical protein